MRSARCLLLVAVYLGSVGAARANNDELRVILAEKDRELVTLSSSISAAGGPEFATKHDLEVTLRWEPLRRWMAVISSPQLAIAGEGTLVEGDLYYVGGSYKVWLENPRETKASIGFQPFSVSGAINEVMITSRLTGHAETRVYGSAGGITTNVFCSTSPDSSAPVEAILRIGSPVGFSFPYIASLTRPSVLNARVVCRLGGIGNFALNFPMADLARELGRGTINLGFSGAVDLAIPGSGSTVKVPLTIRGASIAVDVDGVKATADITVGAPAPR